MHFGKRLVGLITLSLLLGSLIPASLVFAKPEANEAKARAFIQIAENAKEQAARLKALAVNRGLPTTASDSLVALGDTALTAAQTALVAGDHDLAIEKAREAADKYRGAIKTSGLALTGESESPEEAGRGLLVAISRAEDRIQRLRDVVAGLPDESKNAVIAKLDEAQADFNEAKAAVQATLPDVMAAAQKLASGNKKIAEAFELMRAIEGWITSWRSEAFLQGIKQLVDRIKEIADKLPAGPLKTQLTSLVNTLLTKIDLARSDLKAGNIAAALQKVKEVRDLAHGAWKEANKAAHKP